MKTIIALLAVVAAYATVKITQTNNVARPVAENAYDRVMRTNTLRCGYGTGNPAFIRILQPAR